MKTINRFRFFIAAAMAVVLTGFASCSDEPEMPLGDSPAVERDTAPSGDTAGEDNSHQSECGPAKRSYTIKVSGGKYVQSITINGQHLLCNGGIPGVSGEVKVLEGSMIHVSFVGDDRNPSSSYTIYTPGGQTTFTSAFGGQADFTMLSG